VLGSVERLEETSLAKTELQSAELAWEEVDDGDDVWWWDNDAVNTVNHTVGREDVDGNDAAVEVDSQAAQADLEGNTLRLGLRRKVVALEQCRCGMGLEDTLGWVEAINDVVREDCLELLLAGLGCVLWDLLEGLVGRREELIDDQ